MIWIGTALTWVKGNRLLAAGLALLSLVVIGWAALNIAVYVGERRQAAREASDRAQAITGSVLKDAGIKDGIAAIREQDLAEIDRLNDKLEKADDQAANSGLSDARRARLCELWRQQRGASKLPAACRP